MKQPIEVRDAGNEMLIVLINGNQVAKLSHDQADELAGKLMAVTCRLRVGALVTRELTPAEHTEERLKNVEIPDCDRPANEETGEE